MITTIPFSGFYESLHDSELDNALRYMFSDRATGCDVNEDLCGRAFDLINWGGVREDYAKEYAESFAHWFGIKSLKFESLDSPRFYNFTTDRIFCTIDPDDLRRIMATFDLSAFAEYVREKFTSRDGFASHYSPDLAEWGNPTTYDHNQAGAVMEFYAMQEKTGAGEFDQWAELDLLEDARGNGCFDDILIGNAPELWRLLNIHSYLQDRSERLAA